MSEGAEHRTVARTVHCAEALQWLRSQALGPHESVFTSLPDSSEVRRLTFDAWTQWFRDAAEAVVRATHPDAVAVFYQTDVKREGCWVDKSFLVQQGAHAAGARLLWHKIVCRAPAGTATATPEVTMSVRLPGTILPAAISLSIASEASTTRSNGSSACTRLAASTPPTASLVSSSGVVRW